jgi:AAA domain-containing protein
MTLVVVSGAPGTGKSTVAAAVAGALRWPLISLDPVKEALADVLGLGDENWSDRMGDAAAEVVFRLSARFPTWSPRAGGAGPGANGRCASSLERSRCSAAATRS